MSVVVVLLFVFFAIRILHTMFALVTGVQTCALPILQHMDTVCNPHRIDGAIGVAPMILDQLVDARPQPLPRLGGRCAPKLDHKQRYAHVFLDCNRELPEISLGGALPEQRSSSRLPVHLDYTYLDIERNTDRKSTRLNSSH